MKTCTARKYAEVMGQNYFRFKTGGLLSEPPPADQKKRKECPGVVCDLATLLNLCKVVDLMTSRGRRGRIINMRGVQLLDSRSFARRLKIKR